MKKILILLLTSSLFSGVFNMFNGVDNPNGRPGMLSCKWGIHYHDQYFVTGDFFNSDTELRHYVDQSFIWSFILPITNYFTISGKWDYYESINDYYISYPYETSSASSTVLWSQPIYNDHIFSLGMELHLPLYKLWN